jgi:hypothetical protein
MVTKVKKNRMKIRRTLPIESQNSASPKIPTARALIKLWPFMLAIDKESFQHLMGGPDRS